MKIRFQQPYKLVHDGDPDSRKAMGETHGPQKHHPPGFFFSQRRAPANGVAADEIFLQLNLIRRRNDRVGQTAEPGVDPVNPSVGFSQPATKVMAPFDTTTGFISQTDFRLTAADGREHGKVEFLFTNDEFRNSCGTHNVSPIPASGIIF
jgi:hypothetical protein